jgi:hypothetical protein
MFPAGDPFWRTVPETDSAPGDRANGPGGLATT